MVYLEVKLGLVGVRFSTVELGSSVIFSIISLEGWLTSPEGRSTKIMRHHFYSFTLGWPPGELHWCLAPRLSALLKHSAAAPPG
jgi:hypothetical protein